MQIPRPSSLVVGGALVAALVFSLGCGSTKKAGTPVTQPVVPGIYSVKSDGSHLELLIERPSVTVSWFLVDADGHHFRTATTSPDGRRLAYIDRDAGRDIVWLLDVASRESRQLAIFDQVEDLEWAPGGNSIAVLGRQDTQPTLSLLAADTGELRQVLSICWSYHASLSWAPDGKHIALSGIGAAEDPPAAGPYCEGTKFDLTTMNLETRQLTTLGKGYDLAWSPDGSAVAFVREDRGLYRESFPPTAESMKLADEAAWPAWSPDGRTLAFSRWAGLYAIAADGKGSEVQLAEGEVRQPKWAPGGRSITFVRRGEVFVVAAGGGDARTVAASPFPFLEGPDWLDDDRILFSLAPPTDSAVLVANSDGSGQRYAAPGEGPLAWSPDGRRMAFRADFGWSGFTASGGVYVLEPKRSKAISAGSIFFFTDLLNDCYGSSLAWSSDSSRIAFSGPELGAEVFDVSHETRSQLKGMYLPSWSPDGTTLAVQSDRCQISFVNLESGASRPIAEGSRPTWSPDGKWVAFDARHDGLTLFNVESETKVVVAPWGQELTWSPDSRQLAFVDGGHIFVAGVAPGENAREIAEGEQIAWSPAGRTLAFAKTVVAPGRYVPCGGIAVVDVQSGVVRELPGAGANPRWSPDGKVLVFEAGNAIYAVSPDAPSLPKLLVEGSSIAWSPDGSQIAFVRQHGTADPVGPPVCAAAQAAP